MKPPVQIQVKGLAAAKRLYGRIQDFGANPVGLLEVFGGILEASTRRRFDTGQGPGGIPWPPSQRVLKHGGKTLVDDGNLESSVRYDARPGELEVGVDGVGASSKFAYVHQFGFEGPVDVSAHTRVINESFGIPLPGPVTVNVRAHTRNMSIPKRPILGVDDDDKADMKVEGAAYLERLKNA